MEKPGIRAGEAGYRVEVTLPSFGCKGTKPLRTMLHRETKPQ